MKTYFIIDFDSTFIKIEALDKLAEITLSKNPEKEKILKEIIEITNQGMSGEIPFDISLSKRLALFQPNKNHLHKLVKILKKNITTSIEKNKKFFREYKNNIYIITGGFKDYVFPVIKSFGLDLDHVLANEFIFNENGRVVGFNKKNLLSQAGGKVRQVKELKLKGNICVIGDGYTDYEIKEKGVAHKFIAFCENVKRENVIKKADHTVSNFHEIISLLT